MSEPEIWWHVAARARSPEVWAGIAGGMIYIWMKSPLTNTSARIAESSVGGLLAYATGKWAAEWAGIAEPLAVILITAVGYPALDVARSLVADREILKDIIIRRLGGGSKNG